MGTSIPDGIHPITLDSLLLERAVLQMMRDYVSNTVVDIALNQEIAQVIFLALAFYYCLCLLYSHGLLLGEIKLLYKYNYS